MNHEVLQLAPGGNPLAQSLGFTALSVIVDNLTSSYVTLGDVGKTIPPWTYGAVVALPPGLRRATASLTPTTPAIPGPPVPVSQATLTWIDQPLMPDPGHLLQQSQLSNTLLTDRIDTAAGTGAKSYAMPAGAQTIAITVDVDEENGVDNRSVAPTLIRVEGLPSGSNFILAGASVINANPGLLGLVSSPTDTQFEVSWTMAGANPLNVFLDVAVFGVNLVHPQNVAFQFYGPNLNVGVTEEAANPATWQAAATMIGGTFAVAAGTDHTLVGGVAGLEIWVFDLMINHNGNVAYEGSLWDGPSATGVERGKLRMPAADTAPAHIVGAGAKAAATAGNSLIWRPDAEQAGTTTYFTLAYSQG